MYEENEKNIENSLPPLLQKPSVARLTLIVSIIVSLFGIGGGKLHSLYTDTMDLYTATNSYGQGIQNDFSSQADAAANIIRLSGKILGENDSDYIYAKDALDNWNETPVDPSLQYDANKTLCGAIDTLYTITINYCDEEKLEQLQSLYDVFLSCQDTIARAAANQYNPSVEEYNTQINEYPAKLIGFFWGCTEVDEFASSK